MSWYIWRSPLPDDPPTWIVWLSGTNIPFDAVTTPTTFAPPANTFNPVLAVATPTESTFLTSSYVRTPPTETLPVNAADDPFIAPAKVLNCSKFRC